MNILLDTCTFLWMIDEVDQLSPAVREAFEDGRNRLILHQASSWEIQIKYHSGKLPLAKPPREIIRNGLVAHGIEYQTFGDAEIWHLQKLPGLHRDPFDRILISYALCEGLKFASPDPEIQKYPVAILW
ncbi:MAG: type II toxin-antitoxin system VapC family toxin [Terrimicrobiaceae bacterium]